MITLNDPLAANVEYAMLRTQGNKSAFIGAGHSDLSKDLLTLTSNPPKRTNTSYGNRRSSINLVRSVSVPTPDGTTEVKDMKLELVMSIPAGVSNADFDEAVARITSVSDALLKDIAVVGQTQH